MKIIPLTRGKETIVDDEDYERLIKHSWAWRPSKWSLNGEGYAVRGSKKRGEPSTIYMHREILNAPEGSSIDHINLHSLDNRKSRYKGVFQRSNPDNPVKPWTARIRFNDRRIELGTYEDEETAAAAYNLASRILFGDFRYENQGIGELGQPQMGAVLKKIKRYIDHYEWLVDTVAYRFFYVFFYPQEDSE